MPWTYATFLVASLSLAGLWPLAGFWSKDGILAEAWKYTPILFYLALITVFMTAFYVFRALFMTFGGDYRGSRGHLHESPLVMVLPLVVLALLAVASGWLGVFTFLGGEGEAFFGVLSHPIPLISLGAGLLGILLAYALYSARWLSPQALGRAFAPLYTVLSRKYWFDELYEGVLVGRVLGGVFAVLRWADENVVDGVVNGVARATLAGGGLLRRLQTGQLQAYGFAIGLGVLAIMVFFYLYGRG